MSEKDFEKQENISNDDFKFVNQDKSIHDLKFSTKTTTFFKDIVKRFIRNKASVVGFCIIGFILLCSVIFTLALPGDINNQSPTEAYLPPKLFPSGTGFWDGTRNYKNMLYDKENEHPVYSSTITEEGIASEVVSYETKVDYISAYSLGGTVSIEKGGKLTTPVISYSLENEDLNVNYSIDKISDSTSYSLVLNYALLNSNNKYLNNEGSEIDTPYYFNVAVKENSNEFNTVLVNTKDLINTNLSTSLKASAIKTELSIDLVSIQGSVNLKSVDFSTSSSSLATTVDKFDIGDNLARTLYNVSLNETKETKENMWSRNSQILVLPYQSSLYLCSFTYDPYQALYGEKRVSEADANAIDSFSVINLKKEGAIDFVIKDENGNSVTVKDDGTLDLPSSADRKSISITITTLDKAKNYILVDNPEKPYTLYARYNRLLGGWVWSVEGYVINYVRMGYSSMPLHLFGTDVNGYDMLKLVSRGTLISLGLGVAIASICLLFGLAWGSISGYFGGVVDLFLERIVDLLSYIPGMIILTLLLLIYGRTVGIFILAMCMTGWIGTSALTRTQFYRFKGHEYVLASRSLGASDIRLISRHILPNALGTIITSSVLMIPSVIYSEASLSYLGLGFNDIMSLGRIINDNQSAITTVSALNPTIYLIIFPSVVLALLLISFEMFGQGLRDSVNPNLKGSD